MPDYYTRFIYRSYNPAYRFDGPRRHMEEDYH